MMLLICFNPYVDSPHKLYAGNLGWNLTSQGLKDAFANQPGVLGAKVVYERDSGRSRGFGFVSFGTAQDLQSAMSAIERRYKDTVGIYDQLQSRHIAGKVDQAWRTDGFNTYQWLKPSTGLLLKDVCLVEADVCVHGITSANKRTTIATQVSLGLWIF
ncbi:hypothetical protein YC2023_093376 [Brassica napus]